MPPQLFRTCVLIVCLAVSGVRAGVKEITAPLVGKDKLPTVDGTVDADEWAHALSLHAGMMDAEVKGITGRQMTVHMIADDEALYVGLVSPKWADELKAGDWQPDDHSAARTDDRYELVVKPPLTPPIPWYHVIVNSAGNVYDHQGDPHRSDVFKTYTMEDWDGEWTFEQSVTKDEWHMEFRIPINMFDEDRTKAEGQWEIGVGRGMPKKKRYVGLASESNEMVKLNVLPDVPAVELHQLGNLADGELDAVFKLKDVGLEEGEETDRTLNLTCVLRDETGGGIMLRKNKDLPVVAPGEDKTTGIQARFSAAKQNMLMLVIWDPESNTNLYQTKAPFSKSEEK
ncbi:MAG: hypothetical protein ACOCUY_02800 [Verrucomicrobiota bacterium]